MRKIASILLVVSCSLFLMACGSSDSDEAATDNVKKEGTYVERLADDKGQILDDGDIKEISDLFFNFRSLTFEEGYESDIVDIIDIDAIKKLQKEIFEIANSKTEESFALLEHSAREEARKAYNLALLSGINKIGSSTKVNEYEFLNDNTIKMNISSYGIDWTSYKTVVDDYIEKNIDELNPGPVGQEDIIKYAIDTMSKIINSPVDFGVKGKSFDMDLVFVCKNGKWNLDENSTASYIDNVIYMENNIA